VPSGDYTWELPCSFVVLTTTTTTTTTTTESFNGRLSTSIRVSRHQISQKYTSPAVSTCINCLSSALERSRHLIYNSHSAEAGKLTVGLASHWPCVTDNSGLSTYGLNSLSGRWATHLHSSWGTALLYLLQYKTLCCVDTHKQTDRQTRWKQDQLLLWRLITTVIASECILQCMWGAQAAPRHLGQSSLPGSPRRHGQPLLWQRRHWLARGDDLTWADWRVVPDHRRDCEPARQNPPHNTPPLNSTGLCTPSFNPLENRTAMDHYIWQLYLIIYDNYIWLYITIIYDHYIWLIFGATAAHPGPSSLYQM